MHRKPEPGQRTDHTGRGEGFCFGVLLEGVFCFVLFYTKVCVSYFSVAVMKHHGQGSLQKGAFNWGLAYSFRVNVRPRTRWEAWRPAGRQHGTAAGAESSPRSAGRKLNKAGPAEGSQNLNAHKAMPPNPSQMVPPTGGLRIRAHEPCGTILIQTTEACYVINPGWP